MLCAKGFWNHLHKRGDSGGRIVVQGRSRRGRPQEVLWVAAQRHVDTSTAPAACPEKKVTVEVESLFREEVGAEDLKKFPLWTMGGRRIHCASVKCIATVEVLWVAAPRHVDTSTAPAACPEKKVTSRLHLHAFAPQKVKHGELLVYFAARQS
ncbi:unnamed protein product, partial [Symbiodinium sp. CCMP2592]